MSDGGFGLLRAGGTATGWLPAPLTGAEVSFSAELEPLFPEEADSIKAAVAKRKTEFQAGRHCARQALKALGETPVSIERRADRTPAWPAGVIGSIAHSGTLAEGCALAIATNAPNLRGAGIDVERLHPLDQRLWRRILTDAERRVVEALPAQRRGACALLHFCAKEAFYKCEYPQLGARLDFRDVQLEVDAAGGFRARTRNETVQAWLDESNCNGRYRRRGPWLVCLFTAAGRA